MKTRILPLLFILALLSNACSTSKNTALSKPDLTRSSTEESKSFDRLADNNTFLITEISTDKSYGSEENPIKVGGVTKSEGPINERRFLNALAGPNGEEIEYNREGSCCHFPSKSGFGGMGLLDIYNVTWEGQKEPVQIYINMYDFGGKEEMKAPVGFTLKEL